MGEPSGAAAASGMDVDELEGDDEDAAAQRMPPPGKRARGSQRAAASRGALPLLGLGLSLQLPLQQQTGRQAGRQAAVAGSRALPTWVGASARHQGGGSRVALAGTVAPFRA